MKLGGWKEGFFCYRPTIEKISDFRALMEKFKIHQQYAEDPGDERKVKEDSREKVLEVLMEEERAGEAWRRKERGGGQGRVQESREAK